MLAFHSISSPSNPLIKDVRRAILRGALTDRDLCVAESFHLLREALASGRRVESVLASESARTAVEREFSGLNIALVPNQLFSSMCSTENSQGVIALVEAPRWGIQQLFLGARSLVVVLDGIQDPGNAGAIVRAAEAFGATGVLFTKGSVSPFNPKTLRASAGSLFRIPFVESIEPPIARAGIRQNQLTLYTAMPHAGSTSRPQLHRPCAIVIGNEGRGVSADFQEGSLPVSVPTKGVESLNASVAAAILLYEAFRDEPV